MPEIPRRYRFGIYDVDATSGDCWKQGLRVRIHGKPFQVLTALLERPGEVVTRKALQERLWPDDTYVEFENGLNNAISRLREALGDAADNPRFIETVPRRGYRFIAPVERVGAPVNEAPSDSPPEEHGERAAPPRRPFAVWAGIAAVFVLIVISAWWWSSSAAPASPVSVAVLPFVTSGGDETAQDEYLAFGMTDALISELSQAGSLKVISQTSVLRYRTTDKRLPEIAAELGVGTIVEGSVVREGEHFRITVQLINAQDDTHLWTETYRRTAVDAIAAQGDLARSVARDIRMRLTNEAGEAPGRTVATDPRVREAHLKGRYFMSLGTEAGRATALASFEEALAIDPDHAPSHAGAADYYILTDSLSPDEATPKARAHAERALALDPSSADAHVTLAFLHYYGDWNWPEAERRFRRALELNPGHTRGRRWYAMFLAAMGRQREATAQIERVLEVDPVSIPALDSAAQVWFHTRQRDRLLEVSQRLLHLSPGSPQGHEHLAASHVLAGDYGQALAAVHEGLALNAGNPLFVMMLAYIQGALGQEDALSVTMRELLDRAEAGFVTPFFLAIAHAGADDRHAALEWLERGHDERDAYLVFLRASPWLDNLRSEPRFRDLVTRMKFP